MNDLPLVLQNTVADMYADDTIITQYLFDRLQVALQAGICTGFHRLTKIGQIFRVTRKLPKGYLRHEQIPEYFLRENVPGPL